MKKFLIIVAILAVVIIAAIVVVFLFFQKPESSGGTSGTNLPGSGPTGQNVSEGEGGSGTASSSTMTVAARGTGTPITVNDFIHNGTTIPNPSNSGNYILTGNENGAFSIGYDAQNQFFTIALQQEPIGQSRLQAEQFLLSTLGLTQTQLCDLNYYLGTDEYTNSTFAGKNLGFSFCPGATPLPQ